MDQDQDRPMRKKVADFCRQAPIVAGSLGILIIVLIIVLIIWFIPLWQVPVSGLSLKDRLHQINENRKTVAQIVGGVFILWGLYIAWVRSEAARKMAEVNREQQLTDLYVKAIEQLGSENLQIRLGGIYALERIARESPKDHWPIMEVLTAFVRENAPLKEETPADEDMTEESSTAPGSSETEKEPETFSPREKPPTDIQAVLTVLGRTSVAYAQEGEERSLDLRATHLSGVNLVKANLTKANFSYANLREADLSHANLQEVEFGKANIERGFLYKTNLQGAHFYKTNLQEAFLFDSNLQEAGLGNANLRKANLMDSNLQRTSFPQANLNGADFSYSNLQEAFLHEANLQEAVFEGADLRDVDLQNTRGLTAEKVAGAIWDETTLWPEGFSPPPPRNGEDDEEE